MSLRVCRDSSSARALMGRVLREGKDLEHEYPLVFGPSALGTLVVEEQDGTACSTCAILPRTLLTGELRIAAGLIGSVATDPEWRNRGFGGRVLQAAEEELRRSGAWLAVLWADDPEFYTRRGWQSFGCEVDAVLSATLIERLPRPKRIRPMQPHDAVAIHELYCEHQSRVERTREETRALLACPGMEVLVCEDEDGVAGYACLGRGGDLEHVVHEWGGEARAVAMILRRLLELRATCGIRDDLFVMLPADAQPLIRLLFDAGASLAKGVLGMGKILNEDAARAALAQSLGVSSVGPCTGPELLDALFPTRGEPLARAACAKSHGIANVPPAAQPFIWGLDSI